MTGQHETKHPYSWPRACTCNDCGHIEQFDDFDAVLNSVCKVCGAHGDGDGHCWCLSCSTPITPQSREVAA
jgi:hypothetical protein